jgi:hypothetical protein
VSGHQVYLAGQVGVDKDGKFVEGTIKDRTRALLEQVNEKLKPVGCDLSDSAFDLFSFVSPFLRCPESRDRGLGIRDGDCRSRAGSTEAG